MKKSTNISEFERLKPTKTYKSIQIAKKYWKNKLKSAAPIMDAEDQIMFSDAEIALELIEDIEKNFLSGL